MIDSPTKRPVTFVLGLLAAATLFVTMSLVTIVTADADTAPASTATPATVSADPLPTVQTDGVVWTQIIVGNTVYVGGDFTTATPAGQTSGGVARSDMLAYNLTTGVLINSFAPVFNGQVRGLAASPDGKTIYAVGSFTTVNGVNKYRVVALDATTGAINTKFVAKTNASVYSVAATATTVYLGGIFTTTDDVTRTRVAAVDAITGAIKSFSPTLPDGTVRAIVVSPDASKVVIGGSFSSVNGSTSPGRGMAMVDATAGTSLPWAIGQTIQNYGKDAAVFSLTTDGASVYGTAYRYNSGTGTTEGSFKASWADGSIEFVADCHGDTYSATVMSGVIYTASHAYDCSSLPVGLPYTGKYNRVVAFTANATGTLSGGALSGLPAPSVLDWYPELNAGTYTGQSQAAWSVASGNGYVVYGGEFTTVNGVKQAGLVRFATKDIAPNKQGPQVSGSQWVPTATSSNPGSARLSWQSNWDRDNATLTYAVYRDGATTPVYTVSGVSRQLFQRPMLTFVDTGLAPGATVTYRITATDPFGNVASSAPVSVTVQPGVVSPYASQVIHDGAADYWRLDEASGSSSSTDWTGTSDLAVGTGTSLGSAGAIVGDADTAATFSNDSSAYAVTSTQAPAPNSFSAEAWFKTTTTTGGRIVGYSNSNTADRSNQYDRQIYMDQSGTVVFGVYNDQVSTVQSGTGYNDGTWHHVVASLGSTGMQLFIDGKSVSSRTDVTSGSGYNGFWRIGSDNLDGWPGNKDTAFDGSIDDVAIYPSPLAPSTVLSHYALGTGNRAPAAAIAATVSDLTVAFDGSASADPDGTISSYLWDFGDGTTGSGVSPSHTYTAAGSYPVTLTVTDNSGGTGSATKNVSAVVPNVAPTASLTTTVSGLSAAFDGSGSTDADGSVASYAWDFGDGTSGNGVSPSHTYTAAGSYTVTLTVTDNAGATGTRSATIAVTAPVAAHLAQDGFARTVASGLGTADIGGAWTVSSAAPMSVGSGVASLKDAAGSTLSAYVGSVSSTSTDVATAVTVPSLPVGGTLYVGVVGRRVGSDDYNARVVIAPAGTLQLSVLHAGTALKTVTLTGVTAKAGTVLHVRMQTVGSGTSTLRARAWVDGTAEPSTWQVSATDTTAALQAAGSVGLRTYLGSPVTNGPLVVKFDDFVADQVD